MENTETNYTVENNTLKTTETVTKTLTVESQYNLEYLYTQKRNIEIQREEQNRLRDLEIEKIDALIDKCLELGLTPEPAEEQPVETE
jgi:hypothetical protein